MFWFDVHIYVHGILYFLLGKLLIKRMTQTFETNFGKSFGLCSIFLGAYRKIISNIIKEWIEAGKILINTTQKFIYLKGWMVWSLLQLLLHILKHDETYVHLE